jgi:peptide/nickel transport system permease protein
MSVADRATPGHAAPPVSGSAALRSLRVVLRTPHGLVGLVLSGALLVVAFVGPLFAPHGANEVVGVPYAGPGPGMPLGADYLGQDVLSRFLHGGSDVLLAAFLATTIGIAVGTTIGLVAAYLGGWADELIMRTNDVMLAFPQIVAALVLLATIGPEPWLLILIVGVSHAPRVARLAHGMASTLITREFIQSAEALGERRVRIWFSELLPNMSLPLLAETGLRLTYSIGLIAAIGFLGFVADPRSANWGMMINENRLALTVQPWAVLTPVVAIALLTIGTNLVSDAIGKASGGRDTGGVS